MLLLAVLTACTQRQPAGAPASAGTLAATPSATAGRVAPAPEAMTHAGPRITLSPDNVHIEYHVYGSGEPAVVLVHGWACGCQLLARADSPPSKRTTPWSR